MSHVLVTVADREAPALVRSRGVNLQRLPADGGTVAHSRILDAPDLDARMREMLCAARSEAGPLVFAVERLTHGEGDMDALRRVLAGLANPRPISVEDLAAGSPLEACVVYRLT